MYSLSSSMSSAQLSPFNRYFTPSLSNGPPSPSSCRFHPEFENFSRDDYVYSFNNSRRASIDSNTSRASSYLTTSPHHSRNPSLSPMSPLLSSSHSFSKVYDSPADSHYNSPTTSTSPKSPPTERNQGISRATPGASHQDSQPSVKPYTLPVISIPPAQASDLTFDPTKKTTKRSSASKRRDKRNYASSSRQGDSKDRSSSPPPVKYRFVSVQEAQPSIGRSLAAAARGNRRGLLRLEERMEEEREEGVFEHGPTEFPPRPYPGGEYATSPFRKKKEVGRITGTSVEFVRSLSSLCYIIFCFVFVPDSRNSVASARSTLLTS